MRMLRNLCQPHLLGHILHTALSRLVLGLLGLWMWECFVNSRTRISAPTSQGCFVIGIFFLTCAWLGFLALDGFDLTKGLSQKTHTETPAPGNHLQLKNLIRMPAESSRELDTEERNAVKLGANLIAGCCFLLLYTVA